MLGDERDFICEVRSEPSAYAEAHGRCWSEPRLNA
jgi:hypothetical protein